MSDSEIFRYIEKSSAVRSAEILEAAARLSFSRKDSGESVYSTTIMPTTFWHLDLNSNRWKHYVDGQLNETITGYFEVQYAYLLRCFQGPHCLLELRLKLTPGDIQHFHCFAELGADPLTVELDEQQEG
ncbi:predicted protein [Histoplasma capsulatum G186AR]|uniref:Uncharacterized protein n=1 Tax=Ajellomyces capsulatus (strain G186AR / H82 / ATCC MYA-2454 / RMSCC 2432) TaxID=447093 RepID=C0NKF9_AJECG|nr:uncharacterized protein HCBG_03639 [Histoplasma capsulatum G186AR]EEH08350.1 predicted protein [Histoplasma capsulatum G186AR]